MADRKTITEWLRKCSEDTPAMCKKGCPFYKPSSDCINDLMRAALELIEGGSQEAGNGDFVSRQYLLAEYDRQHQGPPGGARKIIEEAPAADVISRRDAIEAACKGFCHPGVRCPEEPCQEQTKYIRSLPPAAWILITDQEWEIITTQLLGQVHTPVTMDYETSEKMIAAGIKEVMDKWKERLGI